MVTWPLPAVTPVIVGTPGIVDGTTELLALDATLVPFMFVAVTVKVYEVPLVKPVTVIGEPELVAV
jgi:hypothetical protein